MKNILMLKVIPIPALRDNYIWCMYDTTTKHCLLVDPGEAKPAIETIEKLQLNPVAILVTHHHWDHSNGVTDLINKYDVEVFACDENKIPGAKIHLKDGDEFLINKLRIKFKAIRVPCHTLDHTAFYTPNLVFTGDTLFTGGCGKFFEGTPTQMFNSLEKLKKLSLETLVYCGHEYTQSNLKFAALVEPKNIDIKNRVAEVDKLRSQQLPTVPASLAIEMKTNPFLRTNIPDVIKSVEDCFNKKFNSEIEVLAALREWKNSI